MEMKQEREQEKVKMKLKDQRSEIRVSCGYDDHDDNAYSILLSKSYCLKIFHISLKKKEKEKAKKEPRKKKNKAEEEKIIGKEHI